MQQSEPQQQQQGRHGRVLQGADYPDAAADEHLQSVPNLCSCSEVLLRCEGGESALKAWLQRVGQQATVQVGQVMQCQPITMFTWALFLRLHDCFVQEGSVMVKHEMQGQQLLIVRPGSSFQDWGVLHKKRTGMVECKTCVRNKKHCKHANYVHDHLDGKAIN